MTEQEQLTDQEGGEGLTLNTLAAQTQADSEDRPAAGWVRRVVGDGVEYGFVFQQSSIQRLTYYGPALVFQGES